LINTFAAEAVYFSRFFIAVWSLHKCVIQAKGTDWLLLENNFSIDFSNKIFYSLQKFCVSSVIMCLKELWKICPT